MKGIFSIFNKDERAFTGLESAIVLTAFVVVAAVFSYVVLGAGFTTSDTAKATIDEGIKQTTSSVELAGDVIAYEGETTDTVDEIVVTLQLAAGQSEVDIGNNSVDGMLVVSYWDSETYEAELDWEKVFIGDDDTDDVLEQHEKVQLTITTPTGSMLMDANTSVNTKFRLEVKPKVGAILPLSRITPAEIDVVMNLR